MTSESSTDDRGGAILISRDTIVAAWFEKTSWLGVAILSVASLVVHPANYGQCFARSIVSLAFSYQAELERLVTSALDRQEVEFGGGWTVLKMRRGQFQPRSRPILRQVSRSKLRALRLHSRQIEMEADLLVCRSVKT
jgi:hypothetical protein